MNRRRIAVLATIGMLATGGASALVATPTAAQGVTTRAPVNIATYNVEYGRSNTAVVSDLRRLASDGADVMGLQEMGSGTRRKAVLEQFVDCSTCQYDAFMPNVREQNAVPILYNWSKFRLLEAGGTQVSARTFVGASGAGPKTLKAKWVNWVLLRHRVSGQSMYVLNSHAVPSVQASNGGPNTSHPERLALYRQHMDGLKTMITNFKRSGAAVFSTGDFNVNHRRDMVMKDKLFPYVNMAEVGVNASFKDLGLPSGGTHLNGTRLIDYVFSAQHPAVRAKRQAILRGYGSDHRPVLVRYALAR